MFIALVAARVDRGHVDGDLAGGLAWLLGDDDRARRGSETPADLAAGLAERQPDRTDGRSSFALLTPAGKDALKRAWPVYRQAIRRHFGTHLSAQQHRELATLLEQVAAELPANALRGACRGLQPGDPVE